jgi:hypothetical protein
MIAVTAPGQRLRLNARSRQLGLASAGTAAHCDDGRSRMRGSTGPGPNAHFMIAVTAPRQWLRFYHRPHEPGVVPAGLTSNRDDRSGLGRIIERLFQRRAV